MKKRSFFILSSVGVLWALLLIVILSFIFNKNDTPQVPVQTSKKVYEVYSANTLKDSFVSLQDAIAYAETFGHASVRSENEMYWNNYENYIVYQNDKFVSDFNQYNKAVSNAKNYSNTKVYYEEPSALVWENQKLPSKTALINAPLISQMPELPRGCEVTSLAMLLQYAGVVTDKMKLAKEIIRDPTQYIRKNGVTYFGNPNEGFVGDMYSFSKPGYGVYHGPIKHLAEQYMKGQIIDMTGSDFEDILYSLQHGIPVWVIVNTRFTRLDDSLFETWETPSGQMKITYKEHSVLITGYDKNYVYFNDPLANMKNRKIAFNSFREAWEQMGKQAINYLKKIKE